MKFATLSLNKGLLQQQARSVFWPSILFTIALLILQPLYFLMRESYYKMPVEFLNTLISTTYFVQIIAYILFPTIISMILLNYTTKKASVDFVHSLPLKKATILFHSYVVGALAILLPIIVTAVATVLVKPTLQKTIFSNMAIVEWLAITTCIVLFMLIFAMFIGTLVGNTLLQGAFVYVILALPVMFMYVLLSNVSMFVNGLAVDRYFDLWFTKGIPFIRFFMLANDGLFSVKEYIVYPIISIAFFIGSFFTYYHRPTESSDEAIVFPWLRKILVAILTAVVAMITGLFFGTLQNHNTSWVVIGYAIGLFLGYTLLEMIVQKTLRLSFKWKHFAVIVGLFAVFTVTTMSLYERSATFVPETANIEKVYIGQGFYELNDQNDYTPKAFSKVSKYMYEQDSIELVRTIHQEILKEPFADSNDYRVISIEYVMKNGKKISRNFKVQSSVLLLTKKLEQNKEFKQTKYPILAIDANKINYMMVNNGLGSGLVNGENISALLKKLQQDILENDATYFAETTYATPMVNTLEIFWKDDVTEYGQEITTYLEVNSKYKHTLKWIKEYQQ